MKESRDEEKGGFFTSVESVLDINSNNVWTLNEFEIAELWEKERQEDDFSQSEEKLLNTIRIAFEVNHFNAANEREAMRFQTGWALFSHCNPAKGSVAIRRKSISKITDLSYENVKHITAAQLLDLIDKNFGGGWDSLSLAIRDIIESGFDVSTTQLPASRIHAPGGTVEKKVAQGFEVLEIVKGTWIEAIFAKKKDPVQKLKYEVKPSNLDEDGNPLEDEDEYNENEEEQEDEDMEDPEDDDTFYSSYAEEAQVKNEDDEGFPLEEED